ncbi:hypothetical protein QYE76_068665 [Lolium multiflorum]|uniref:Retrotransposon Copia-like N-terminal domain-containing protein n=1 Tax=Lolium multiflorum TaxID=4521 RepID=A0AAD8SEW1_LOLMU|nr:hypothetical protein QYE76_068665 [Lolium multiflorum]
MASSSTSSSGLAAALGAPPAQQLMRGNFLLWKALVLPAFRGANVMALLDGTDAAPANNIEVEDAEKKKITVENPAYVGWLARDQQVLRFLLNTLSPDILSHLLDVSSTAEAWSVINSIFKTASRTKAHHLREKLNDMKKLSMTANSYYTKMKGFASELSAFGKPIGDDEMLGYLLHGLDKTEYNALITSVNANPSTTLDDFYEQLSSYDMRNGVEENGEFVSSANLARRGREQQHRPRGRTPPPRGHSPPRGRSPDYVPYRSGGSGNYRDREDDRSHWRRDERPHDRRDDRRDKRRDDGRRSDNGHRFDRTPTPYVDTDCQICTKHGHPASKCWWRYSDDKKNKDDREKGANLASYGVDTNWYTDTGATDHITGELNKLLVANKYHGQESVRTAEEENSAENSEEISENCAYNDAESASETDENGVEHEEDLGEHSPGRSDPEARPPVADSPARPSASHHAQARAGHMPDGDRVHASNPSPPRAGAGQDEQGSASPSPGFSPSGSSANGGGEGEYVSQSANSENSESASDNNSGPSATANAAPPSSPPGVNRILSQKP